MTEPPLIHATDEDPGIRRKRVGRGFAYYWPNGTLVADKETRARLRRLVIPPAWTSVWISQDPMGHLQATGRDARGRKQYLYHPDWRSWREHTKFTHILDFAARLPRLRERVEEDLQRPPLSEAAVLAAAVRVLEQTLMRVGNDVYAAENKTYGLTTLKPDHVERNGRVIRFSFRGKAGKTFEASLSDRRVGAILRRLEGLRGQHLFRYLDGEGTPRRITSDDVNAYIREAAGDEFSAKDFRTWAATVLAALALLECEAAESERAQRTNIRRAIEKVAQRLGNTPTVCRQSYVHPEVIEGYVDGTLARVLARRIDDALAADQPGLTTQEAAVLAFLKRRLARARRLAAAA